MAKITINVLNQSDQTKRFLLEAGISPALIDDINEFQIEMSGVIELDGQTELIPSAAMARIVDDTPARDPVINTIKGLL